MSFVLFLVFIALSQLGEGTDHLKSIKLNEKIIYDCIEIYKQPSLSHPLLKNHKIQMKPSHSILESKNKTRDNGYKKNVECPEGTVPILRTTPEDGFNVNLTGNHFQQLAKYPPIHRVGVKTQARGPFHGFRADLGGGMLYNVGRDQVSTAHAYVSSGRNIIKVGWMVNPGLLGDSRMWSCGSWKGVGGKGCYNLNCQGFVQVSKDVPLSEPMSNLKDPGAMLQIYLHQDKKTRHWWITQIIPGARDVNVGYWPKELFDTMANGATEVGYGGTVRASPSGASPPMGDGRFPTGDDADSAYFSNLQVVESHYVFDLASNYKILQVIDSPKCYGLKYNGDVGGYVGVNFQYGGPGGASC